MSEKKKMDSITKAKLIYTVELVVFAIVFLILGLLILLSVILINDWKRNVFPWVTLVGGFFVLGDLAWALLSKKRRARISLFDKLLLIPSALCLIVCDLIALISQSQPDFFYQCYIGATFCYLASVYLAEAVYHWFFPIPGLVESEEEAKAAETPDQSE